MNGKNEKKISKREREKENSLNLNEKTFKHTE